MTEKIEPSESAPKKPTEQQTVSPQVEEVRTEIRERLE